MAEVVDNAAGVVEVWGEEVVEYIRDVVVPSGVVRGISVVHPK